MEEVEEWNEYGELKQQIGSTAPTASSATPSASASNTPSKAPVPTAPSAASTTTTPSKATATPAPSADDPVAKITSHETNDKHIIFKDEPSSKGTTTEEPESKKEETPSIALALRQAGAEAAKKAGEKKAEKNAAFKSSLAKNNDGPSDTPASQPVPPAIEPTPAQVRNAPSPTPEAVSESVTKAEPTTEASLAVPPADEDDVSPVVSPPTGGVASASLGGDPPPLHYSPKATPAVTSTSSLEVADEPEEAEHIREKSVQADAPKEVIEQVESQQTIPEDEDEDKGKEKGKEEKEKEKEEEKE